jgi:hypothetical protein
MLHALSPASPTTEKLDRDVIPQELHNQLRRAIQPMPKATVPPKISPRVDWPHNHCSQFGLLGPEPQRQITASQSKNPRLEVADHLRGYSGSGVKALGITAALD